MNTSTPCNKDETQRSVVAVLEEDIVFGRLHPCQRLTEDELMSRFQVKRHVVREVLATLDHLGLVERRKHVGALVRSFTPREVEELYALRTLLETEAVRLIPLPVSPGKLGPLMEVQRRHDAAVEAGDATAVFRANLEFHATLFELCGNTTLVRAIAEYARQTHPIRFGTHVSPDYRQRSRQEHWQLIDALGSGDCETLVRLCREHLQPSRDAYLEANRHRYPAS